MDKTWTPIQFGSYNIQKGRNRGLESAMRGVSQANLDLGVLQETNITDGVYTCGSTGYSVDKPILQQSGGVLPGVPTVFDRGNPEVLPKRHQISAGDGGVMALHHHMYPFPQICFNNRECSHRDKRKSLGSQTSGGRGF